MVCSSIQREWNMMKKNDNSDDEIYDDYYSEENDRIDKMSSITKMKSNLQQAGYRDGLNQEEERIRQHYFDEGLQQGILCGELAGQLYGLIRQGINTGVVQESQGDRVGKLLLSILSASAASTSTSPSHGHQHHQHEYEEEGEEGCSSSHEDSHGSSSSSNSGHARELLEETHRLLQSFPQDVQDSFTTFRSQIEHLLSC